MPDEITRRLEELKRIKRHRLENERFRYYTPIGKGEEFINHIGSGKYIVTLLSAANGIGKTYVAANLLANLFWPNGNKYFQHEIFKDWPFPKKGRIVSDPTTVQETIIPTLKAVFPKGRYGVQKYETSKDGKHYQYHWVTDTGWEFNIMSYEQDAKEFESATLGWFWFDEPPPQPIYKATIARLRLGGVGWITATPLTGSAWMYDEIITNPNNEAGFRAFVTAEVEDACEEHGVRGFLQHEQILKQIAQYDDEDKQARIFGKFQHLTGLVFKQFDTKIHVVRPFVVSPREFSVINLLDSHPRNPDAVLWVATNRRGEKFVIDELYKNFTSTGELAAAIKAKDAQYRVEEWYADPSAWNIDQHKQTTTLSLAAELEQLGLPYEPASKDRSNGIILTRNALSYELLGDDLSRFVKPPMLYFFDTCVRTIWEIQHWQYNEWTGKTAEKRSPSEKPVDKNDHEMENLGRAFLNDPGFVEYVPPREAYHPLDLRQYNNQPQNLPKLDPYE